MFWRRTSAVCTALLVTLAAAGGGSAQAQTLGDLARSSRRAIDPPIAGSLAQAQTLGDLARSSRRAIDPPVAGSLAPDSVQGLFGTTEFASDSLRGLPQWTRVLAEMSRERAKFDACAQDAAQCTSATLRNWHQIIASAAKLGRAGKIRAVNEFFNRWPYKEDREIYRRSEYWAAPSEFMARSGDCEDYAIAKYFALRQLGFGEDQLRIVILMDEIRGIGHAVLAVYEKDQTIVLDSLSNLILPHDRYKHYRPQYSMNGSRRWAHVGGYRNQPAVPYKGLVARRN